MKIITPQGPMTKQERVNRLQRAWTKATFAHDFDDLKQVVCEIIDIMIESEQRKIEDA